MVALIVSCGLTPALSEKALATTAVNTMSLDRFLFIVCPIVWFAEINRPVLVCLSSCLSSRQARNEVFIHLHKRAAGAFGLDGQVLGLLGRRRCAFLVTLCGGDFGFQVKQFVSGARLIDGMNAGGRATKAARSGYQRQAGRAAVPAYQTMGQT